MDRVRARKKYITYSTLTFISAGSVFSILINQYTLSLSNGQMTVEILGVFYVLPLPFALLFLKIKIMYLKHSQEDVFPVMPLWHVFSFS